MALKDVKLKVKILKTGAKTSKQAKNYKDGQFNQGLPLDSNPAIWAVV